MKKFLILLVAIVGLTVKSFAQTTEFELDNWRIRVNSIQYETQVRGTFGIVKNANPDAIFVIVDLTVRNDENRGDAFYPQVWLKLLVAEKEIDGEDLGVYLENIEPTLVKDRQCYFEVPKAFLNQPMVLRFKRGWFGTTYNVAINAEQKASDLIQTSQTNTATQTNTVERTLNEQSPAIAKAESQLRRAWNLLPSRKQEVLRDEQSRFVAKLDTAGAQDKLRMITDRTIYLLSQ